METIKLNLESIVKMLESKDEGDVVVALAAMDNLDFKANAIGIALAYKNRNHDRSLWKKHAPKIIKIFIEYKIDANNTFQDIYHLMLDVKPPVDQVELFVSAFNKHTRDSLMNYGYDFIDTLNITIKPID
jgi:hypothetical protein